MSNVDTLNRKFCKPLVCFQLERWGKLLEKHSNRHMLKISAIEGVETVANTC
jgi:hypothetical protein